MAPALLAGLIAGLGALGISVSLTENRLLIVLITIAVSLAAGLAVKECLIVRETEDKMSKINSGSPDDD